MFQEVALGFEARNGGIVFLRGLSMQVFRTACFSGQNKTLVEFKRDVVIYYCKHYGINVFRKPAVQVKNSVQNTLRYDQTNHLIIPIEKKATMCWKYMQVNRTNSLRKIILLLPWKMLSKTKYNLCTMYL